MRKYSMSEEAEKHVGLLLRLTYILACLLHTIITIRVVSNAGLSRSVRGEGKKAKGRVWKWREIIWSVDSQEITKFVATRCHT